LDNFLTKVEKSYEDTMDKTEVLFAPAEQYVYSGKINRFCCPLCCKI